MSLRILVKPDGDIEFIFNDALVSLLDCGESRIRRVSHVEPAENEAVWLADMAPIGGPILGPFALRSEALQAELDYLRENLNL